MIRCWRCWSAVVIRRARTGSTRDRGVPLAGKSTLNRLELTPSRASVASRYKKIAARHGRIESFLVNTFLRLTPRPPEEIVLDFDATDDPLHGHQLGRFFHGYYDGYCYLPLYVFCGEHLLCAKLRPANIDACLGALGVLQQLVARFESGGPGCGSSSAATADFVASI